MLECFEEQISSCDSEETSSGTSSCVLTSTLKKIVTLCNPYEQGLLELFSTFFQLFSFFGFTKVPLIRYILCICSILHSTLDSYILNRVLFYILTRFFKSDIYYYYYLYYYSLLYTFKEYLQEYLTMFTLIFLKGILKEHSNYFFLFSCSN